MTVRPSFTIHCSALTTRDPSWIMTPRGTRQSKRHYRNCINGAICCLPQSLIPLLSLFILIKCLLHTLYLFHFSLEIHILHELLIPAIPPITLTNTDICTHDSLVHIKKRCRCLERCLERRSWSTGLSAVIFVLQLAGLCL